LIWQHTAKVGLVINLGEFEMSLEAKLERFTGTEHYYKIAPNGVLTDGTKFLADEVGAYWLFADTAAFIAGYEKGAGFAVIKLIQPEWDSGVFKVMLGDGNGNWKTLYGGEFTDFPQNLMPFEFYASWDGGFRKWVFMLKSEY
jgi:hypothetical protein